MRYYTVGFVVGLILGMGISAVIVDRIKHRGFFWK